MEEVSLTIDVAKLKKMVDEMLIQRCTSGDEHQYHINQMKNFLKSNIIWESRKEIPCFYPTFLLLLSLSFLSSLLLLLLPAYLKRPTPLVSNLSEDPETSNPTISYKSRPFVSEERKKQKEPGKPKEVIYSNSKIIQVIKTYWELGHEHKFITEIVPRRANECIVSITEPDYKNLNKNDIEDMYLLIMNGKVLDYSETGLLWSLSVFIRRVEKHKMFSIIYEPVHGIIYKNSKKEKRVMRHSEIYKFFDATLNRVLEGLRSYNNDVKYGYIQRDLTNEEVEYPKLFKEEIEVRLKYRNQMRR
ncbi:hypothetical protein Tco_1192461 [Tanacetum coccineum]